MKPYRIFGFSLLFFVLSTPLWIGQKEKKGCNIIQIAAADHENGVVILCQDGTVHLALGT